MISMLFLFVLYNYGQSYSLAQSGTVISHQKISSTQGNFSGILEANDLFGSCVASIDDLDGDGITDIAIGAFGDDDGGTNRGAVWILFLNQDGTVKSHQKISDTQGNFTGTLDDNDSFGSCVASIGDLNGDGVTDIAIGAPFDDDGGIDLNDNSGAVWILFLNQDGTVKSHQKISDTQGGFTGVLDDVDLFGILFGISVASIGDLDGDGVTDIAVGAINDDDGGKDRGAVWILFLNQNGTVKSHQKISDTEGNFTGVLDNIDMFGEPISPIGDLNGDGVTDIIVGANSDDDGGLDRGAVWILFLNQNGTVKSHQKISDTEGNFTGILDDDDRFGRAATSLGNLDGDSVTDIIVGAPLDDDGGLDRGSVWVLFLNQDGTVKSHQKISDTQGNFTGILDDIDRFGISVASIGDLNGDGVTDIIVGTVFDDDGGLNRGAVWILFLEGMLPPTTNIPIDIEPGSCPNLLNVKSKGKLKVAILGKPDFDVMTVDVASMRLNGVVPDKSKFQDKTAPAFKMEVCDCEELKKDSFADLILEFRIQDILATLGVVQDGDEIELILTGNLLESAGGTAIEGTDCILIKD